jgi:hypothetical protein
MFYFFFYSSNFFQSDNENTSPSLLESGQECCACEHQTGLSTNLCMMLIGLNMGQYNLKDSSGPDTKQSLRCLGPLYLLTVRMIRQILDICFAIEIQAK